MSKWGQSIRSAVRSWRRQPATALLAVLVLGAALGAQTTFFTVMDGVIWRPLPVDRPSDLVSLDVVDRNGHPGRVSPAILRALQARSGLFASLAGYTGGRMMVESDGDVTQVAGAYVSGEFFDVMHARPILGRLIAPGDVGRTAAATAKVVVISARLWRTLLHGDPQVVGRTLLVEGSPLSILGVVAAESAGLQVEAMNDVVLPAPVLADLVGIPDRPDGVAFQPLIGRRAPDQSLSRLAERIATEWPAVVAAALPGDTSAALLRPVVASAVTGESFLRPRYASLLQLLGGLANTMIVVGCLSVGGLLAAATVARIPQLQVRLALGASRIDLLTQLVVEAGLIFGAGSLVGFVVSLWAARPVLNRLWPDVNLRDINLSVDWRTAALTGGTLIAATLLAAVVPGLIATRRASATRGLNLRTASQFRGRWQRGLLAAQLALTLALLAGGALFAQTLLRAEPPSGLDLTHLVTGLIAHVGRGNPNEDPVYVRKVIDRLGTLPGVTSVALTHSAPFGSSRSRQVVAMAGSPAVASPVTAVVDYATPGFFATVGVPILEGREASWTDSGPARVAVLSASLAGQLVPGGGAVGREIRVGSDPAHQAIRVIGVAADTRYQDLQEPGVPAVYLSGIQDGALGIAVLRVASPSALPMDAVNRVLGTLGHDRVLWLHTFAEEEDLDLLRERLAATLGTFFALLSAVLAVIAIYGRLSQLVTQRRRELGLRLALGATPGAIRATVFGEGARSAAWGIALGVPMALALSHVARSQFYGLAEASPAILGGAIAALVLIAVVAAELPARRAMRGNPVDILQRD